MTQLNLTLERIKQFHSNNPDKKVFISFSGGKDSTALLAVYLMALDQGIINKGQVQVMHSNTLMEMPFMDTLVRYIKGLVEEKELVFHFLTPPLKSRFIYRVIGRGIAVSNRNFRWCTDLMKIKPLQSLLKEYPDAITATGERLGESSARDKKLASCSSDECGLKEQSEAIGSIIRPLLHWRTCDVWDFLFQAQHTGVLPEVFDQLSKLYSINEDSDGSLRTGCIGCPLITKDRALSSFVVENQGYQPLVEVGDIWRRLRLPENRLTRKGYEGKQFPGAIKVEARELAWAELLDIECRVQASHPNFQIVDDEERLATQAALDTGTYPRGY